MRGIKRDGGRAGRGDGIFGRRGRRAARVAFSIPEETRMIGDRLLPCGTIQTGHRCVGQAGTGGYRWKTSIHANDAIVLLRK